VWAPNNRTILYTAYARSQPHWLLWLMNTNGRNRHPILGRYPEAHDASYAAQWSPDGRLIFGVSGKTLFVMNADGTDVRDLTPGGQTVGAFDLSPDGTRIVLHGALFSSRTFDREIFVMNADGTDVRRLTNAPRQDDFPKWSPDGSKIVFRSQRDGNSEIYVMNADGSEQRRLTVDPTEDTSPSWVPG
jgi:Tol biopolymer transport system component